MTHKVTTCLFNFWHSFKALNEFGSLGSSSTMIAFNLVILTNYLHWVPIHHNNLHQMFFIIILVVRYFLPTQFLLVVLLVAPSSRINIFPFSSIFYNLPFSITTSNKMDICVCGFHFMKTLTQKRNGSDYRLSYGVKEK